MNRLVKRWLPPVRITHPWPSVRFDARTRGNQVERFFALVTEDLLQRVNVKVKVSSFDIGFR